MKAKGHLAWWVMLWAVLFFVAPLLQGPRQMQERLAYEQGSTRALFGDSMARRLNGWSESIYSNLLVDLGVESLVKGAIHSEDDLKQAEFYGSAIAKGGAIAANKYLNALLLQLFGCIFRLTLVLAWVALLFPFVGAAILDGLMCRARRMRDFGNRSPTAFTLGLHTTILLSALPFIYVVAPFAVTPWFMPFWAVASAVPLMVAISNF
jgi:hypothetical protein